MKRGAFLVALSAAFAAPAIPKLLPAASVLRASASGNVVTLNAVNEYTCSVSHSLEVGTGALSGDVFTVVLKQFGGKDFVAHYRPLTIDTHDALAAGIARAVNQLGVERLRGVL